MYENEQGLFHKIFESITCFQNPDVALRNLLASLSQWVGSDLAILLQVQPSGRDVETACVHARTEQLRSAFQARFERHFQSDSLQPKILAAPQSAFTLEEHLGDAAWRSSTLYRNVFHHAGATDAAMLLLRGVDGQARWAACFALGRRAAPQKDNVRLLNNAAPHLCAGLENLAVWAERWKRAQGVEVLLECSKDMLVCVNPSENGTTRVVAATHSAQRALGLNANAPTPNEGTQEFLDLALSAKGSAQNAPRWLSPTGLVYRVSQESPPDARIEGQVCIRLELVGANEPSIEDDLHSAHAAGLSARESAVFAKMARGLGNRKIAESLGISIDTVRAHLRNVFAKLNVSSRVEAVNAVRRGMETPVTLYEPD